MAHCSSGCAASSDLHGGAGQLLVALLCVASLLWTGCFPSAFDKYSRDKDASSEDKRDAAPDDPDAAPRNAGDEHDGGSVAVRVDGAVQPETPDGGAAASDGGQTREAGTDYLRGRCEPAPVVVGEVALDRLATKLASLTTPQKILLRYPGPSVQLGSERLFTFTHGHLPPSTSLPAGAPPNYPTAARDGELKPWLTSDSLAPVALRETLNGELPYPLLELTAGEVPVPLTPESIVLTGAAPVAARAFVAEYGGPTLNVTRVWSAPLAGQTTLGPRAAAPLFSGADRKFVSAGHVHDGYVYLYACEAGDACFVARAPLAEAAQRSSYAVFELDDDGKGTWVSELARGTEVLRAPTPLSIHYSEYLGRFLAVHSMVPNENAVLVRWAARPEGPFSPGVKVALPEAALAGMLPRAHWDLDGPCSKRLIISYLAPTVFDFPVTEGAIVFAAIALH